MRREAGDRPAADERGPLVAVAAPDDRRVGGAGVAPIELQRTGQREAGPRGRGRGDNASPGRATRRWRISSRAGFQRGKGSIGAGGVDLGQRAAPTVVAVVGDMEIGRGCQPDEAGQQGKRKER